MLINTKREMISICWKLSTVQWRSLPSKAPQRSYALLHRPGKRVLCSNDGDMETKKSETVVQEEDAMYFGDLFEKGKDPQLFGENVDPDYPLPPEYASDFWESPKFGFIGTMMAYFVPVLVVLGLIVGGIAASSFNQGATSYLTPSNEDSGAVISPIKETEISKTQ